MEPHRGAGSTQSQTHGADLFQWGGTNMDDWGEHGYSTTNAGYGVHYPFDRRAMELKKKREQTPWGTSNAAYGKELKKTSSDSGLSPLYHGSFPSFKSPPLQMAPTFLSPNQNNGLLSPAQKRQALEERLDRIGHERAYEDSSFKLPALDRSKYLVAQGPPKGFKQSSTGYKSEPLRPSDYETQQKSISAPVTAEPGPPPKTGPARKYMRDTLDRFLNSIPEDLRPKTRKLVKAKEPPQVLKVKSARKKRKSALPNRNSESAFSHSVPSTSSSSSSSRSSSPNEELIDLNDSIYDLSKETKKNDLKE